MLSWRKMRRRLGKLLMLMMVALAWRNAQCFALCLTQPDDSTASHCHQHGQAKAGHCSQQHDLRAGSAGIASPESGLVAMAGLPAFAIHATLRHAVELLAPSPPVFGISTLLPLRV
jgi:hypothetical protein